MPLGYDKVEPVTAEVIAKFYNGDPAITVNKVGKGLCFMWTPMHPALSHTSSDWEMHPNKLDFWPNAREMLQGMVLGGLKHQGAKLPVETDNLPTEVEITVRSQPEHNRTIVHVLNYDTRQDKVDEYSLTINVPDGKQVARVFYPDTETEINFVAEEGSVAMGLRSFEIHDMIVVQWK